jgi:hypothetical protein
MKNFNFKWLLTGLLFCCFLSQTTAQNALDFDGADDYITVPGASAQIANGSMAISCWVYPTNPAPNYPNFDGIVGFRNDSNADFYLLHLNATSVEARFKNSSGVDHDIVYSGLVLNAWNHFVYTYDGTTARLYHNGVFVSSVAATGYITNTSAAFSVGYLPFSSPNFHLDGKLDDVCLWNKNLSAAEASTLYNACSVDLNSAGLALCYEFSQGTSGGNNAGITTATDSKGNINGVMNGFGLTGTASNFTAYSKNAFAIQTAGLCGGTYTSPTGNILTTTGTYLDTIVGGSFAGCDSIITTNLIIGTPTNNTTISPIGCGSYTSPSGNNTWTTSGTYVDTLAGFGGCDSIITINLSVGNPSSSSVTAVECASYTTPSGNNTWTTSGTYMETLTNAEGCDSVITYNISINNTTATMNVTACGSYTGPSGNNTWTVGDSYLDKIPNYLGCDSLITINLTINPLPNTNVSQNMNMLTSAAISSTYQWLDCDNGNAPIAGATNPSYTAMASGNYAVEVTNNGGCVDTSACKEVVMVNTVNVFENAIEMFPNPSQGVVQVDLGETYQNVMISVTDAVGKVIFNKNYVQLNKTTLNLEADHGIYFVKIIAGKESAVLKLLVE